jgi:hypothetical protein
LIPDGRQHLKVWVDGSQRDFETHLIIAGSGAAMRDRDAATISGDFAEQHRLNAALCSDTKRIQLAAPHVAGDQKPDDTVEEDLSGFHEHMFLGTQSHGVFFQMLSRRFIEPPGVNASCNDWSLIGLSQPRHAE